MSARYFEKELALFKKEWDAVVKFHADPFVRFWIPLRANQDVRLLHFAIRWAHTRNPYYVWQAIDACISTKREFNPWIVKYLAGCAGRMLSEQSKHSKDSRGELDVIFGFPKRKRGPGDYRLRPDGSDDAYIYLAVAEYFAAEIEKGATPPEARKRAHQKCVEYRYQVNPADIRVNGKPIDIDETTHLFLVESLAADVDKKLDEIDDKTLRINIEKLFGVKKSPRTNAEWKQVIAAWRKLLEQLETLVGK